MHPSASVFARWPGRGRGGPLQEKEREGEGEREIERACTHRREIEKERVVGKGGGVLYKRY